MSSVPGALSGAPLEASQAIEQNSDGKFWLLSSGSKVFALAGLSDVEIAKTPTDELRVTNFAVTPDEVTGWESKEMSKNALKKAMADIRYNKLVAERERRKLAGNTVPNDSRKRAREEEQLLPTNPLTLARRAALEEAILKGVRIVVDCSFSNEDLMTQKELHSLGDQIKGMWASIRTAPHPLNMYVTSLRRSGDVFRCLERVAGFDRWLAGFYEESFSDVLRGTDGSSSASNATPVRDMRHGHQSDRAASSSSSTSASSSSITASSLAGAPPTSRPLLCYLSADSPHVLTELRPDTVYIIGGLIDRNRHRGLTQARAEAAGIPTARLPIDAYVRMAASRMLTSLHVAQILLAWQTSRDWKQAFLQVIPARKGVEARGDSRSEPEPEPVAAGDQSGPLPVSGVAAAAADTDGVTDVPKGSTR